MGCLLTIKAPYSMSLPYPYTLSHLPKVRAINLIKSIVNSDVIPYNPSFVVETSNSLFLA